VNNKVKDGSALVLVSIL